MTEPLKAHEAKVITENSKAELINRILEACDLIRKSANAGKVTAFYYLGSTETWVNPKPRREDVALMDAMTDLGYSSAFVRAHGEPYVPRGLADDGFGSKCVNYGIIFLW